MRTITAVALFSGLAVFAMTGCGPTYPREKIADSVLRIIEKEYKLTGSAKLVGETLYLDVKLPGLVTTEQKVLSEVLEKVQGAVLAVTRVALSSDARITYVVITVQDSSWKLSLRFIQRIEDVKALFYQRISRSDYEDRLVIEIETPAAGLSAAPLPSKEMEPREFLGRLVTSQINMLSRNNPFLSLILGNSQLEFSGYSDEELVIRISSYLSPQVLPFFQDIVSQKAARIIGKFPFWQPRKIRIIEPNDKTFVISVPR
ncbi:MAG: hypothetical protein ACYC5N_10285 [Endomicrobiales bacterium]